MHGDRFAPHTHVSLHDVYKHNILLPIFYYLACQRNNNIVMSSTKLYSEFHHFAIGKILHMCIWTNIKAFIYVYMDEQHQGVYIYVYGRTTSGRSYMCGVGTR